MFCGGCLRLTADESSNWKMRDVSTVEKMSRGPWPTHAPSWGINLYQPISTWSTHRVALMKNCDPPELACPVFAIDRVPAELLSSDMNSSWGLGDLKEMLQKAMKALLRSIGFTWLINHSKIRSSDVIHTWKVEPAKSRPPSPKQNRANLPQLYCHIPNKTPVPKTHRARQLVTGGGPGCFHHWIASLADWSPSWWNCHLQGHPCQHRGWKDPSMLLEGANSRDTCIYTRTQVNACT